MKKIELLAPGGDVECIKAAIVAGANAVYCGLERFNARNRAANITFADLRGILRLAHEYDAQVFLTLNIIIVESEIPGLVALLNKLVNTTIDGLIVQDLGLLYLLSTYFPSLNVHASTQLTTHNSGQLKFLQKLHVTRVNLSRELSLVEIKALTTVAHEHHLLIEVFVHGSLCLGFSGLCYMSSVKNGNSGNRGRCSQPCRDEYLETAQGRLFPLNLKDNSGYADLQRLVDAGVDSIKIEGRIKKSHYVYTVVDAYKKQLLKIGEEECVSSENADLYTVFSRGLSNGFLQGDIHKEMFIDNPRDHSAIHLAGRMGGCTEENVDRAKRLLYDTKTDIINEVRAEIAPMGTNQYPLEITISGVLGEPLKVEIKTDTTSFVVSSATTLMQKDQKSMAQSLSAALFSKRFKSINDTDFYIARLDTENLADDLFIPFKELTTLKNEIVFILNGSRQRIPAVEIPDLAKPQEMPVKPTLSVLINSVDDLHLCAETGVDIYFEIPSVQDPDIESLFHDNPSLIPWFPAILIGEDYTQAIAFLDQVQPQSIVTNNLGIAHVASERGISWVAGPQLNLINSYSLLCLKEKFNCSGGFISNEINHNQMKKIKRPDDFKLYYSIYHPIMLMTSRQCLFQQVTGCHKNRIDETCIGECSRSAPITNLKNGSFILHKSKGNYHSIYNEINYLNTEVVTNTDLFAGFLVDLRRIETATQVTMDQRGIIKLFAGHLAGDGGATDALHSTISPTTSAQYVKGI